MKKETVIWRCSAATEHRCLEILQQLNETGASQVDKVENLKDELMSLPGFPHPRNWGWDDEVDIQRIVIDEITSR